MNDGIRLKIPNGLHPTIARQIYRNGYERPEIELLKQTVECGDTVLDLGAGLGQSAVVAAMLSGTRAIAVEADPKLLPVIRDNAAINSIEVEVVNAAVGVEDGEAEFFIEDMFVASSLRRSETAQRVVVPAIGIRTLLARYRPTYLNADVEGVEFDILPLVNKSDVRCISVETHDPGRQAALVDAMRANGFTLSEELSAGVQMFFV